MSFFHTLKTNYHKLKTVYFWQAAKKDLEKFSTYQYLPYKNMFKNVPRFHKVDF